MHPDLSAHLHTEECNILIAQYKKCHADHPFKKFFGHCNDIDRAVWKCVMKERSANQKANREKAKRVRDKIYGQEKLPESTS